MIYITTAVFFDYQDKHQGSCQESKDLRSGQGTACYISYIWKEKKTMAYGHHTWCNASVHFSLNNSGPDKRFNGFTTLFYKLNRSTEQNDNKYAHCDKISATADMYIYILFINKCDQCWSRKMKTN